MKTIILLFLSLLLINSLKLNDPQDTATPPTQSAAPPAEASQAAPSSTENQATSSTAEGAQPSNSNNEMNIDSLINKIYEYAKDMAKSKEDPEKRRLKRGIVSNFYPKIQRDLMKKNSLQEKNSGYLLKYLTEPYRFCIFPYSETNSISYCDNNFRRVSSARNSDCKHMMCINCCDHLLYILKLTAEQSVVSKTLGLEGDAGYATMKGFVTPDVVENCRATCKKEYPVEEPLILPPPPKDPTLGKTKDNPAKSCMDIKVNGLNAKDGVYYLKSETKKLVFPAYCDMTTEEGGWTLFLAYNHHPSEIYGLNSTAMPTNPIYGRSHMILEDAGFDAFDVTEIRLFCTTSNGNRFVHFKTHNPDMIKLAMTGDQTYLKISSLKSDRKNMEIPKTNKAFNLNRSQFIDSISQINKNKVGGIWDSPFASNEGGWTIRGSDEGNSRWECGDLLDGRTKSGSGYETLHQAWFRGMSPSKDFLEARLLERTTKIQ